MQTELSFSIVFTQAANFIRNRFWPIALISLFLNLVSSLILKNTVDLATLTQLLQTENSSAFPHLLKLLVIKLVLFIVIDAILIAVIYNYSIHEKLNLNTVFSRMLPNLLYMIGFELVFLIILPVVFLFGGLIFMILGLIIPNTVAIFLFVIVAIVFAVFFNALYYNFCGLITQPTTKTFFEKFAECNRYTLKYWRFALPMMLIYFLVILVVSLFNSVNSNTFLSVIYSTLLTILNIFTICFFYRLNMLLTNNKSDLEATEQNNNLII
ncbi:hypothetical protein J3U21_09665 [Gilliamella sp. B2776]|uniref:hypothetical protein n=1 Tax=unclassified Gilliamella TaxID=2685620 RepID=UPI002269DCB8|nr:MULTISPECIES: hypothetical protein [unclassified Gilliamella]MCX8650569.1 hypothetical protein [Gilliamella sp. B2779]MCX8654256.1 hypothetical protein [Gilliamella sp. B2737]MCX8656861.1 hypothetical protein [Gilliamella sp. B2894]MCX8665563.1 hypothetical protein [Gilliamella sp. B2887]MCX8692417.1 hypothetical protein [Gilliamella sp. B2776]